MLVLTRKPGEQIIIADNVRITVVSVGPGRVKIGIEAPPTVRVDRAEIHERIQQEKAADVLEAVSSGNVGPSTDQPTLVVSGPDTGVLSAGESQAATAENPEPTGIRKYRSPRKPR